MDFKIEKVNATSQPTTTSQPTAISQPTTTFQVTTTSEDLRITSTSWEGITNLQPLDENESADTSQIFEKLWTKINQARKLMIQKHSDQLCQAHNKYINQAKELDSMEFTPEQRQHHHRSLEQHHKHIWYSISKNHSFQRVNFVTQEEQMFRQKLDEIRKKDITWMPTDYNFI